MSGRRFKPYPACAVVKNIWLGLMILAGLALSALAYVGVALSALGGSHPEAHYPWHFLAPYVSLYRTLSLRGVVPMQVFGLLYPFLAYAAFLKYPLYGILVGNAPRGRKWLVATVVVLGVHLAVSLVCIRLNIP